MLANQRENWRRRLRCPQWWLMLFFDLTRLKHILEVPVWGFLKRGYRVIPYPIQGRFMSTMWVSVAQSVEDQNRTKRGVMGRRRMLSPLQLGQFLRWFWSRNHTSVLPSLPWRHPSTALRLTISDWELCPHSQTFGASLNDTSRFSGSLPCKRMAYTETTQFT